MRVSDEMVERARLAYAAAIPGMFVNRTDDEPMFVEAWRAALTAALGDMVRDAERYRFIRKVTPHRFKRIQDSAITDAVDTIYFHANRFDAGVDAAMIAAHSDTGEG